MNNYVTISSRIYPDCRTEIGVSFLMPRPDNAGYAALTVNSGASRLQTYATATDLRALATMLTEQEQVLDATTLVAA
jgi:hypothetical protein